MGDTLPSNRQVRRDLSMVVNSPTTSTIVRSQGINESEQYLKRLCDRTFLSLWSYPGVYRDQNKITPTGDGKEVVDLLVVFGHDIVLFSDKACKVPRTGDAHLDWSRWYRRAIEKSADQLWGAERWIRNYPHRLYMDRQCLVPFPLELPDLSYELRLITCAFSGVPAATSGSGCGA